MAWRHGGWRRVRMRVGYFCASAAGESIKANVSSCLTTRALTDPFFTPKRALNLTPEGFDSLSECGNWITDHGRCSGRSAVARTAVHLHSDLFALLLCLPCVRSPLSCPLSPVLALLSSLSCPLSP